MVPSVFLLGKGFYKRGTINIRIVLEGSLKMRKKIISAQKLAILLCRMEGLEYKTVKNLTEKLLSMYAVGQSKPVKESRQRNYQTIHEEKQGIRRRYIEIIIGKRKFTDKEYEEFILDVVTSNWFKEKADNILDEIEKHVTRAVSDGDCGDNLTTEGKQIKKILKEAFLSGANNIKSDDTIYTDMGISRATFFRRRDAGVVIFGMLMWYYAKRREYEDIIAGIVDKPNDEEYMALISRPAFLY